MNKKIKRELIEWVLLIGVFGGIYMAGWHTIIIGKLQQIVLTTGLMTPDETKEPVAASYEFVIEDEDGKRVSFNEFKGQVVFLNFWATWCPPCIAEMPDIHQLYQATKDKVAFVLISVDKDEQKAISFARKKGYEFPVYFLRSPLPKPYDIHAIPTTYLLDKNGYIRIENHGMAKYNTDSFRKLLTDLSELQATP